MPYTDQMNGGTLFYFQQTDCNKIDVIKIKICDKLYMSIVVINE